MMQGRIVQYNNSIVQCNTIQWFALYYFKINALQLTQCCVLPGGDHSCKVQLTSVQCSVARFSVVEY